MKKKIKLFNELTQEETAQLLEISSQKKYKIQPNNSKLIDTNMFISMINHGR